VFQVIGLVADVVAGVATAVSEAVAEVPPATPGATASEEEEWKLVLGYVCSGVLAIAVVILVMTAVASACGAPLPQFCK
jgi:uncharacterized membrane protein